MRRSKQISNKWVGIPEDEKDALAIYFQQISKHSSLSSEEECRLSKLVKKGDRKAREKLILANLRFVVSVARNYQNQGVSLADLVNIGNMGLIKAAEKFDGGRNFKFISYAVWWVRQAILQAISDQSRVSKLPLNRTSQIYKLRLAMDRLEQRLHRRPLIEEICEEIKCSREDVSVLLNTDRKAISLDSPAITGSGRSVMETVLDGEPHPEKTIMEKMTKRDLERAMGHLQAREKAILMMYFGFFPDEHQYTLEEIGKKLNLTRERVRQIKDKSLMNLRTNPKIRSILKGYV